RYTVSVQEQEGVIRSFTKSRYPRVVLLIAKLRRVQDFMAGNYDQSKETQLNSNSFALRIANSTFVVLKVGGEVVPMTVENKDDLFRWINVVNAHICRVYTTTHEIHSESFEVRQFPTTQFVF